MLPRYRVARDVIMLKSRPGWMKGKVHDSPLLRWRYSTEDTPGIEFVIFTLPLSCKTSSLASTC